MDIYFTKLKKNVIILTRRGKSMNIGIDIDGVLTDLNKFQAEQGQKFFNDDLHFFNECAYDFKDMFNCTKKEKEIFWKKNYLNYYLKAECDKYASVVTKKLKQEGHKIILFTNRTQTSRKDIIGSVYKELLKHWLSKNEIVYDEIIYSDPETSARNKFYTCKEKNIEIMIEDQKFSAYLESDICKVIIINRPYNLGVKIKNIIRVNDFEEIYNNLLLKKQQGEQKNEIKYKKKTI